jgi:CRP-like cAMP-binding protein
MPQKSIRAGINNRVLSGLAPADFALLKPHLMPIDLPVETHLETANSRIDHVYFMERGFASVVADGLSKRSIEVGVIGREGMTAVVMGDDRAAHDTYIQVAGAGQRMSAAKLRWAIDRSVRLHRSLLRCVHALLIQTTHTALANGRSKNEERLARWLLMANDRIDGSEVPLTHKFLGIMLGVQRPAVTVAMRALEHAGLISAGRRAITIIDRKGQCPTAPTGRRNDRPPRFIN